MCQQGDEPDPDDTLLWVIPHDDYWSNARGAPASNYYKKAKFSAYLEKLQGHEETLAYAIGKWGERPYGIVRFRYKHAKQAGFIAFIEEEDGNQSHVNVSPSPGTTKKPKKLAKDLLEHSEVVRPWGEPLPPA